MKNELWNTYGIALDTRTPPWSIDYLHLEILLKVILAVKPERAMEIGSHRGHSTAAFLRALELLPGMTLDIVEPKPPEELLRLIEAHPAKDRITLHKTPSWEIRATPDFVFIDGDHRWPALADLAWALARGVSTIAMHDTRSFAHGIESCWGATMAADILRNSPHRTWFCDEKKRDGMWTHRGFGVSTTCNPVEVGKQFA